MARSNDNKLVYVIRNAETDQKIPKSEYTQHEPTDIVLTVTGDITRNGVAIGKRINFTVAQATTNGGIKYAVTDEATRTVTITRQTQRTGRPRKTGTNLSAVSL